MRTAFIGAGLAVVAALLATVLWRGHGAGDSGALHEELQRLKAEVAGLKASAGASSSRPENTPRSLEERSILAAEERRRTLALIEQTFQQESRDPAWGTEAEGQIDGLMKTLHGVKLLSRGCGTTICRVVVAYEDPSEQREIHHRVARVPPFDAETFYQHDRDSAPPTTTMFLARAGHHLPRASAPVAQGK